MARPSATYRAARRNRARYLARLRRDRNRISHHMAPPPARHRARAVGADIAGHDMSYDFDQVVGVHRSMIDERIGNLVNATQEYETLPIGHPRRATLLTEMREECRRLGWADQWEPSEQGLSSFSRAA
jgi:hypothetical protein